MICISLGSNLGNRINNLREAFEILKTRYLKNVSYSCIIETKSILPENAPISWDKPFFNMIIKGETDLSPEQLLIQIKSIESEMGRPKHYERWSPRIIDIDILLWDNVVVDTDLLKIPHPEIKNRPFLCHLLALMGIDEYKSTPYSVCFMKSFVLYPQFVGIVNITNDSFSDGGKFNSTDKAIEQILKLHLDGASIIDIGAQSTRPGAQIQSHREEYERLKIVIDSILPLINSESIKISIDTFDPIIVRKILDSYPIAWINNVKGDFDDQTLKYIASSNATLCIMHSLSAPARNDMILPLNQNPIPIIKEWATSKINRLLKFGFAPRNIIIDPGIGFGKSVYQNIEILQNIEELRELNVPILIGHSRKGYINAFSQLEACDRDLETIAISTKLMNKVDFFRIHNVSDHMRFLNIYQNFH